MEEHDAASLVLLETALAMPGVAWLLAEFRVVRSICEKVPYGVDSIHTDPVDCFG